MFAEHFLIFVSLQTQHFPPYTNKHCYITLLKSTLLTPNGYVLFNDTTALSKGAGLVTRHSRHFGIIIAAPIDGERMARDFHSVGPHVIRCLSH